MLSQLRALIALRFLLLRRSWTRSAAGILAGVVVFVMGMGILGLTVLVGVGLFFLGWLGLSDNSPGELMLLVDGLVVAVLVFWTVGILAELQRSDAIDFRRMLYLPVSLRMVFLLNFAVSLLTPLLPLFVAGIVGAALGLGLGLGPRMLWVVLLGAAFYLMLSAWTYHLRGLLASLFENKRKRQLVAVIATVFFVTLTQLPNLFFQMNRPRISSEAEAIGRNDTPRVVEWMMELDRSRDPVHDSPLGLYNAILPPGWLPLGTTALATEHYGVAALCAAGMTLLGGAGLAAGYRSTHRHYAGVTRRRRNRAAPAPAKAPAVLKEPLTSRSLPLADDDTSALAFAAFLAAVRHPRVRLMSIMPAALGVILLVPAFLGYLPPEGATLMVGMVGYMVFLNAGVFLFNLFGHDAEGFQALILLPSPRHKYLLGRNLAFFPFLGLQAALFSTLGLVFLGLHPFLYAVLLLQFVQAYLSLCFVGNIVSMFLPYRLQKDSMRANSVKPAAFLSAFISLFTIPLLLVPSGIAIGADVLARNYLDLPYLPAGVLLSVVFLALTATVYFTTLPPVGRLLLAREQRILVTLQKDKE